MKKFLDCISIVGATPSKFHGTKKYVSTGAVATTEIDESEVVEVTYEDRPSRANLSAEAGDILFAKMQGTRKTLLLDSETEKNIYSTGFYAVRANPEVITTECLYYLIDSELFLAQKDKNCSGATQKAITNGGMAKIEISVPALSEQGILVDKLKHLTQLIADKKKQLNLFDEIIKSRFIEMFVANKNVCNWSQVSISDVSTNMRTGPFGSALHHDEFVDSGVFVLGIDNAVENRFSYNRMRYITEEKYNQLKRYTVYPGDVIITIMGTVGRSAVIPQDMPKAINTKHLACITPDSAVVDPCFLSLAFQMHPAIRLQLQNQCKGAIMDGLNLTIIKGLRFQLPPIDQQKQFSEFVEQTDKSKFEIQQSLEKLEILKKSLMQQYFG